MNTFEAPLPLPDTTRVFVLVLAATADVGTVSLATPSESVGFVI